MSRETITVLLCAAIYRRVVRAQVDTLHGITKLNFVGFWKIDRRVILRTHMARNLTWLCKITFCMSTLFNGPDLFYSCGFYRWNNFKRFIERQLMSFPSQATKFDNLECVYLLFENENGQHFRGKNSSCFKRFIIRYFNTQISRLLS